MKAFQTAAGMPEGNYVFSVHGGTIMAIMERIAKPAGRYYDYHMQNGNGYILNADGRYENLFSKEDR